MNILDEDIPSEAREVLRRQRIRVHQIGHDIGHKGIKDEAILSLLHQVRRPTLFTLDAGFFDRRRCHPSYCAIYLDVDEDRAASFIRRVLRHRLLNTQAKRMGTVVRVSPTGIRIMRRHGEEEVSSWPRERRSPRFGGD